jgi:hypothetical protein
MWMSYSPKKFCQTPLGVDNVILLCIQTFMDLKKLKM